MTVRDDPDTTKGAALSMGGALGRVTSILCIPYGYTVSLGCAAILSVVRVGSPTELDVLLFAAGAVGAFVGLACLGWNHLAAFIRLGGRDRRQGGG